MMYLTHHLLASYEAAEASSAFLVLRSPFHKPFTQLVDMLGDSVTSQIRLNITSDLLPIEVWSFRDEILDDRLSEW